MPEKITSIPQGFHTVTPFILLKDAGKFVSFAERALGAKTDFMFNNPENGKLQHAQLTIGNSKILVGDAMEYGDMPLNLYLYLDNPDAAFDRAKNEGVTVIAPMEDQFYGDRSGGVKDPFGNIWWFAKHIEDVSQDELARRVKQGSGKNGKKAA